MSWSLRSRPSGVNDSASPSFSLPIRCRFRTVKRDRPAACLPSPQIPAFSLFQHELVSSALSSSPSPFPLFRSSDRLLSVLPPFFSRLSPRLLQGFGLYVSYVCMVLWHIVIGHILW
ncbi:unnamed protein product, partial [Phaeothamnion confervicola]